MWRAALFRAGSNICLRECSEGVLVYKYTKELIMRLWLYLLFAFAGASPIPAAHAEEIVPQQQAGAAVYRIEGVEGISLGTSASVDVRVGPIWSMRATGPAEALADLRVEREGQSLQLGSRDRRRNVGRGSNRRIRIFITLPQLRQASVSGSGGMTVDRVKGQRLTGAVSGSGTLALGGVAVEELDVSISGSGVVTAAGRTGRLKVGSSGSGSFKAPDLRAARAAVSVAGSGGVRAAVDGAATIAIAGSGSVDLGPKARCSVRRAGSGRATCGG
jgi:hypothetical protein